MLALESIYEKNFQFTDSYNKQFIVSLRGQSEGNLITNNIKVNFEYTDNYPNDGPLFEIIESENLSEAQLDNLIQLIRFAIQQLLGSVMIFDILCDVQEKLNLICDQRELFEKHESEQKRIAHEMEEEAKFRGDCVTVESFLKWHAEFIAEMDIKQKSSVIDNQTSSKLLTGRALFLTDRQYDDSDLTFLDAEGGEVVEIDERLFTDIGDIDLDDNDEDYNFNGNNEIPVV